MSNLGRQLDILAHDAAATATGTTGTVSGSVIDSNGYESIVFMVEIGATATNNGIRALAATASAGTFSDLAGTFTTGHTTCLMLEVTRPPKRYLKANLNLGTSAHHNGIWSFGWQPRNLPSTGNFAARTYKQVNSPVSGTATSS